MVNEQQETLSTPGISSNIQNGSIADDVLMGDGAAASRRRAENAMDVATVQPQSRFPVTSATRHDSPMPCHSGGTSTTIVVKSTAVVKPDC
ncbi:MAG: hypothetical protein CMM01_02250 [Rhodopirellula sp.]|nr:hypothetical protein [Rhodopirellula sp.]